MNGACFLSNVCERERERERERESVCVFCASNVLFSSRAHQFSCEIDSNKALWKTSHNQTIRSQAEGARKFHVGALCVHHCLMWGPEVMVEMAD